MEAPTPLCALDDAAVRTSYRFLPRGQRRSHARAKTTAGAVASRPSPPWTTMARAPTAKRRCSLARARGARLRSLPPGQRRSHARAKAAATATTALRGLPRTAMARPQTSTRSSFSGRALAAGMRRGLRPRRGTVFIAFWIARAPGYRLPRDHLGDNLIGRRSLQLLSNQFIRPRIRLGQVLSSCFEEELQVLH